MEYDEHRYYSILEEEEDDVQEGEVGIQEKGSDELLIDAIRGYPHLYNSSLKKYKDVQMKENSWSEIAKIMDMSIADCQNRWLRLRERFAKEQRLRESETRSGSGASHRNAFPLYNHLLFLQNHIKRRKAFTNISNPTMKKRLIDIPNTSPRSNSINISTSNISFQETILNTNVQKSVPDVNVSTVSTRDLKENKTPPSANVTEADENPFSPLSGRESQKFSGMSEATLVPRDSTPSAALQTSSVDTKMNRSSKIKNRSSSYLEQSLTTLSDSLQKRIENPSQPQLQQQSWNFDFTPDKSFGLLVATELGRIPEPGKTTKKQAIIDILWKP